MTEAIEHKSPPLADVEAAARAEAPHPGMVRVAGGAFLMGSDQHYPEERPVHRVRVDGFWIDRTPVTNREFRRSRVGIRRTRWARWRRIRVGR